MASYDMCRVLVIGRMVKDPELSKTANGKSVVKFSIGVNYGEEVSFFDVEAWEKTAENVCQYMTKGDQLAIDGRLRQDRWKDKTSGADRFAVRIQAHSVQFLAKKKGDGSAAPQVPSTKDVHQGKTVNAGPQVDDTWGDPNGPSPKNPFESEETF